MNVQAHKSNRRDGLRRHWQRGYTLTHLAVSLTISGFLIAGAWTAYSGMKVQWKVAAADRVMDQYGHSALMDLTNRLSWCWGGEQAGSPSRWKFYVDDKVDEHRNFHRYFYTDAAHFIYVTYTPDKGLLINSARPAWNPSSPYKQYFWWEGSAPSMYSTKSMDQRDRMTMEGLNMYSNPLNEWDQNPGAVEALQRAGVVVVEITMQYRYTAPGSNGMATETYAHSYIRERLFRTQIAMRNWDAGANPYKDSRMQTMLQSG